MSTNPKKSNASKGKVVGARVKRKRPEDDEVIEADIVDDDDEDEEDLDEDEQEPDEVKTATADRREVKGEAKSFLETLSEGLKSAGDTATRYTKIGVSHAELEKLRYDLKGAQAKLGEAVTRCWDDAPNLGLTARDPAIAVPYKEVKALRLKIREKEAKIAHLKREG